MMNEMKTDKHMLLMQIYSEVLPTIREIAKEHGYAIAVHGSWTRDFDLIAFPWVAECSNSDDLVCAILNALDIRNTSCVNRKEIKPLGRTAYDIQLGFGAYIDLSVYTGETA